MSTREQPEIRKEQILLAALKTAKKHGLNGCTRRRVAAAAGVSEGLVSHYFRTMDALRGHVVAEAVRLEVVPVVAEHMVQYKDSKSWILPAGLRTKVRQHLRASC